MKQKMKLIERKENLDHSKMKNDLVDITEEEVRTICELYNEPFLSFMINSGSWTCINLAIVINTTSTLNKDRCDSHFSIFYDGRIQLSRNDGNWGGHKYEDINPLKAIDYLRLRGYEFKYDIPKKLERKFKLKKIEDGL